jgi:alpha-amylase/alpha-mannosidase (GH57 family)
MAAAIVRQVRKRLMIYWAQLLHFYQPPTQLPSVLEKICLESYKPLLKVFREYPGVKVTVNINGVLTEMLRDHGHSDIIRGLRELAQRGQIEFTGSGKYHPILPLIPPDEMRRQIDLNQKTNAFFFKNGSRPIGFFPPEMAYGRNIIPAVADSGHRWLILSGVACPVNWPVARILRVEHGRKRLAVFFRDDILSNKISFQSLGAKDFLDHLKAFKGDRENIYVITAMDAETYGHHIQNWEKLFLAEVYAELEVGRETYADILPQKALAVQQASLFQTAEAATEIQTVTISQLLELFPAGEVVDPKPSSWSTSAQDIEAGNPYPLWADKGSELHRLQWEHLQIATEMARKASEVADNEESKRFAGIARGLLDRAFHSCQFWWASRRPMWDINLIHMGLIEQWRVMVNAYRAINTSGASGEVKKEFYYKLPAARDLRNKIVDQLFTV